jgi:hypothetical protein
MQQYKVANLVKSKLFLNQIESLSIGNSFCFLRCSKRINKLLRRTNRPFCEKKRIKKATCSLQATSLMASAPTLIHLELILGGKSHIDVALLYSNSVSGDRQVTLVLPIL